MGPNASWQYGFHLWPLDDVTFDGHPDLMVYTFFGRVILDGQTLQEINFKPGNALYAPLGDIDRDGATDTFWIDVGGGSPSVYFGSDLVNPAYGTAASGLPAPPWLPNPMPPLYQWEHGRFSDAVGLGDWTGDGYDDFAVAYGLYTLYDVPVPTDNRIEFHSGADGAWIGGVRAGESSGLGKVVEAVPDAFGDGRTRLAVERPNRVIFLHEPKLGTASVLWRRRGHPRYPATSILYFGLSIACVGDVNGNGSPEIAVLGTDNGSTWGPSCSVVVLIDVATGEPVWELSGCDYPGEFNPQLTQQIHVYDVVEVGEDATADGIPDLLMRTWSHALLVSCAPAGFEIVGRQDGARAIGVTNPVEQSRDTVSVQTPVEDQDGLAVLLVGQQRVTTSFAGWTCLLTPDVRIGEMRRARLHPYAAVDLDLKTAPVGASVFTQWLVGEPTASGGLSWSASAIAKLTVLP